jgi:hypothetical protein
MLGYNVTIRNSRLNLVRDAIDANASPGVVKIYSGTRPGTAGGAIGTSVLLASGTFAKPSAANASGGVLTFHAITYTNAVATNTATWARVEDGAGVFVADGDVGPSGSGTDIQVTSVDFVTGGPVTHVSASITAANA